MEIIYAIYKENIIPLVGGVNPEGIEIGLAEYKDWKLCAMAENEFTKFSEFSLYPVSKSIAVGLSLQGREQNLGIQDLPAGNLPSFVIDHDRKLSDEEQELVLNATSYVDKLELKFATRAKIRQFKDFEDDLSDTKLLVEFLLGYIAEDYITKTDVEKEKFPIKELMDSFVTVLSEKDLRINNDKILSKVSKVIADETFISRIVKSNYIDQLKNKIG